MHTKTQVKQLVITIVLPKHRKRLTTVSFFIWKLGGIIRAFVIKVEEKDVEIKFNYRLNFKANKKLGTKNENGEPQNDGAGILFTQVLEGEDAALINIIQLMDDKFTENDVLDAIGEYVENLVDDEVTEEQAYAQIFEDLKEEMLASGFFVSKIRKYLENLELARDYTDSKSDEASKLAVQKLTELIDRVKKELSSLTAPDKD